MNFLLIDGIYYFYKIIIYLSVFLGLELGWNGLLRALYFLHLVLPLCL